MFGAARAMSWRPHDRARAAFENVSPAAPIAGPAFAFLRLCRHQQR
jgi:hypothetical protein